MMMTGDDLSVFRRALENTVKEPVTMIKLPVIPPQMMHILGKMTDVAVNVVDGAARIVGMVAKHPTVTFIVVAGVIVGVIYFTGGTPHLLAANKMAGQYVYATCQYAGQAASAAYQYSATQASQAATYLYSLVPQSVTNFATNLSASAQQVAEYAYSLIPPDAVKFALGSYNSLINAIAQLYESSQFGTFLQITESRMRTILTPLLQHTSKHFAKHGAKYALAAEVGGVSYALTPPAAAGMRVAAQGVHNVAEMYREWRKSVNSKIMQQLSEKIERENANKAKRDAIEKQAVQEEQEDMKKQMELRLARRAELEAQLPPDLTPYQECPISHVEIEEPVRAVLANGVVKYYEREHLASWINFQIAKNRALIDPTSRLELPYRSADELVVDQEALKIIKIMRELDVL